MAEVGTEEVTEAETSTTAYEEGYKWLFELAGGSGKSKTLTFQKGDTTLEIGKGKETYEWASSDLDIFVTLDSPDITEVIRLGQDDIGAYGVRLNKTNLGNIKPLAVYLFDSEEYPPNAKKEETERLKQELKERVFNRVKEFVSTTAQQAQKEPSEFQKPLAKYLGRHLGRRSR